MKLAPPPLIPKPQQRVQPLQKPSPGLAVLTIGIPVVAWGLFGVGFSMMLFWSGDHFGGIIGKIANQRSILILIPITALVAGAIHGLQSLHHTMIERSRTSDDL